MKVNDILNGLDPELIGADFDKGLAAARQGLSAMSPEEQAKISPMIKKLNAVSAEMKKNGFETPHLEKLANELKKETTDLKEDYEENKTNK